MINLNFGLFWSGSKLSYLRYLTFKSLRHYHPDAKIQLYWSKEFDSSNYNWNNEQQDFENYDGIHKDYMDDLKELDVEIVNFDFFSKYPPNYQSDFFRWWFLSTQGGFYLDADQIILKSFEDIPRDYRMIYCSYQGYSPVGVIGSEKGAKVVNYIMDNLVQHYNPNDYNSLGPWMFAHVLKHQDMKNCWNAPQMHFYPIPFSHFVNNIYTGKFNIPDDSYALHWFGGHPLSQKFNRRYNEKVAKTSDDTISRFVRDKGII